MNEFTIHKTKDGWRNQRAYKQHLLDVPIGSYKIIMEPLGKRTTLQNAWFHSILPEIRMALRDAGFSDIKTNEDAKDLVKSIFFKKKISNGVEEIEVIQGTSKTAKLDFAEKADEIIRWAAEYLGINIAPPEKQLTVF